MIWKYDAVEGLPTVIMRSDEYARYKALAAPTSDEFTNGKMTGFINSMGIYYAHY